MEHFDQKGQGDCFAAADSSVKQNEGLSILNAIDQLLLGGTEDLVVLRIEVKTDGVLEVFAVGVVRR